MTENVRERKEFLRAKSYRDTRIQTEEEWPEELLKAGSMQASARRFVKCIDREEPVLYGDDLFGFNRQWSKNPGRPHLGNLVCDYASWLSGGINGFRRRVDAVYPGDARAREFYDALRLCLDACSRSAERYRTAAKAKGLERLAAALEQVPEHGARDYYEGLILLRFSAYILRLNGNDHVTLGRFDQYMLPYFNASLAAGASEEELLELTELFFISMNIDTDVYTGVQQGDNGQSMVLGGCDAEGQTAFNALTELCLSASEELELIDPKINLRVNGNTPLSVYERGTRLTRQGLGFPQYSNDDVVIPGLIRLGYEPEDARNYAVAACWEFIVPACGADVPNIRTMNFPLAVERAVKKTLASALDFDTLLASVKKEIEAECDALMASADAVQYLPEPLLSAFVRPCIEAGRDISACGAKYNNYGVHGCGISTAADALAAIREAVFEQKFCTAEELLDALEKDFEGCGSLQKKLIACPKMGNNDDRADSLACFVMDVFSGCLNGKPNARGGVYRAGTGSAMEYLWSASKVGATADGRNARQPYGSSFSPSLIAKLNGPLSAVQSFTKFDLSRTCNGGPFTIEIHDTVFRHEGGERKTAMLVKSFIGLGGHQIQINAINRDRLLDAQKHPEQYPNLIVRVWGWSGYFAELDTAYQDHIIRRTEFGF